MFASLLALSVAEPLGQLIARRAAFGAIPYAGGYGYAAKTITPLANPAYSAIASPAGIALRPNLPYAAPIAGPIAGPAPALLAKAAPVGPAVAPIAAAPGPVATQYHIQDELKNYEYGYQNINSAKRERGNAYTGVEGTYSYVDSYGLPQKVDYVADALGFRASGTNFPATAATLGLNSGYPARLFKRSLGAIAPSAPAAYAGLLPAAAIAPAGYAAGVAPLAPGPYAAPIAPLGYAEPTISAPAARPAILTRIQNNPGHAVSYRVD